MVVLPSFNRPLFSESSVVVFFCASALVEIKIETISSVKVEILIMCSFDWAKICPYLDLIQIKFEIILNKSLSIIKSAQYELNQVIKRVKFSLSRDRETTTARLRLRLH